MWQKIKETVVYKGWRNMLIKTFKLPDGNTASFDVVQNGDYVTIAAFTKAKEAILVRQFRPGPERELISFPEGYLESGESPEVAARRELIEETGYQAGKIIYQKTFRRAYCTETRISMLALDCVKIDGQQLDDTEFIEVQLYSLEEFKALLKNPENDQLTTIDSAYLAMDYLGWL